MILKVQNNDSDVQLDLPPRKRNGKRAEMNIHKKRELAHLNSRGKRGVNRARLPRGGGPVGGAKG
jgi:hypothetical protein